MDVTLGPNEPRKVSGRTVESEYSIDHPLVINNLLDGINPKAIDLFIASVKCIQDGDEIKASVLFEKAKKEDPNIHAHARDTLLKILHNCMPEQKGAIYYWLGIHSQYLNENDQAIIWYEKSIEAYKNIGYKKREGRVHCNLGTVKIRCNDPSGMEEYKKAIQLNPLDGIAHICIGVTRYAANDHEGALDAFADAVSSDSERYGPYVISRLQILGMDWQSDVKNIALRMSRKQGYNLQNEDECKEYFQAGELVQLGNNLFQAHKYKEALEIFEKGKNTFPKIPTFYFGISMVTMQFVELRLISTEQISDYLHKAEVNINECIRLAPENYNYIDAKEIIEEYKFKYHVF